MSNLGSGRKYGRVVFPFRAVIARKQRISLWWSQQVSHFHFDPAFSVNITDVRLEATYDIGVYMVGGTEILKPFLESTFINMVRHGNWVCFS